MSNPETTETASDLGVSASVCVVGVVAEALAPIVGVAAANECASVVAALPNIAIASNAKFHVYLHDTQERLTLLASSPNSQHEAESMAHSYLSKPGIEVDSEARVVSSVVLDSSDVADFVFRGPIPAARAAGGQAWEQ